MTGLRPLSPKQKKLALEQIITYFKENYNELQRVVEAEVDVSIEKDDYILKGKIDLLLGTDGELEVLDFKTQSKPNLNDVLWEKYFKQLCIYAYILKIKHQKTPKRLYIYWTSEMTRKNALSEFKFTDEDIINAGAYFDNIVKKIQSKQFTIQKKPEPKVCDNCDFNKYCSEIFLLLKLKSNK